MVAVARARRRRRAAHDGPAGRGARRRTGTNSTRRCSTTAALRGRLFGVLGSSLALGDHLVAHPQSWHLLRGRRASCRRPDELRAVFTECVAETPTAAGSAVWRLRTLYRDRLLVLAALDLAPTVENEPVLPFAAVGAHLSDLADAALAAALTVASNRCAGTTRRPAAGGHRDGQMRCARTELRQRRRRHLRRRARRRGRDPGGRRDDAVRLGRLLRGRRRRCDRRASTASWSARSTRTSPTTSAGPRPGSSRRC